MCACVTVCVRTRDLARGEEGSEREEGGEGKERLRRGVLLRCCLTVVLEPALMARAGLGFRL